MPGPYRFRVLLGPGGLIVFGIETLEFQELGFRLISAGCLAAGSPKPETSSFDASGFSV